MKKQRLSPIVWACICGGILGGCSSSPPSGPTEAEIRHHADSGYIPAQRYVSKDAVRETWSVGAQEVDVTFTIASGSGTYPLVIYMPGLGESSDAGGPWRRAWGEAGYAVLSLQPAAVGKAVLSSELARVGDFRALAQGAFSARSLEKRLAVLHGAFEELRRKKGGAGAGIFARVDLSRVAVAGFDLGAQTAMAVGGEQMDGANGASFPDTVKSVIALSPYADFSGLGFEKRFGTVHLPVLSVTSGDDTDAYGLVTSAGVRQAPFRYMPPDRKYLLLLSFGPHALLAGREQAGDRSKDAGFSAQRPGSPEGSEGNFPDGRSGRGGRGGRRRDGGAMGRSRAGPGQTPFSPAAWKMQLANVQSVTTAYLDATVKDDPIAWEWLSKNAQQWLGESARLSSK